jgi:hypothetical protein
MADKNTPSFAVSVTPKVSVDAEAGVFQAMTVIHEDVRKSLGGSGTVDGTGIEALGGTGGSWANGTYTQLTNSSNAGAIANDADSDNTTTSLLIKHDTDVIAELLNGEAIVLPRCGASSALILATGDGAGGTSSNHVNVEVFIAGD